MSAGTGAPAAVVPAARANPETPPTRETTAAPALAAFGVGVTLAGTRILAGIDLAVHAGEVVALVGPNGAGKSTLLAALAGDEACSEGHVELGGTRLDKIPVAHLARHRAVQLQEARVSFAFTVAQVVEMGRAPWHNTRHETGDSRAVSTAVARTRTGNLTGRSFPSLSGGEMARTSFARALAQETAVLLLDEPTAAMDLRYQELVLSEVRRRADSGAAVVVVLHDLSLASAYADRIVLLQQGKVRAVGSPREVLTAELLEEVYQHPVVVIDHPGSGGLAVLPLRPAAPLPAPLVPASKETP
ncbi:heme ABC transporter ATP-binding protein [Arthrobacter sp. G.S.26]|uniref:heme ABC transporter ATP-binding protein n=1 Tax=Micrococcaceae TaxID=1268 RepID=UPI002554BCB1|nr:heme ABC transporter ATP-binding protein [Pseudarthrobacter sp. MEB009]